MEEKVRELVTELEKGRAGLEAAVKVGRGVRRGIEGLEKGESFFSAWSISLWHRARVVVAHHLSGNLRPCPCHAMPGQARPALSSLVDHHDAPTIYMVIGPLWGRGVSAA